MADTKVSELTTATSVGGSDLLYLIQTNTSKKVTATTLFQNLGNVVLRGNVALDPAVQLLASPGIIDISKTITQLATDSTGGLLTIPNGKESQIKILTMVSTTGGTLTISSNIAGSANVSFNNVGDTATLLYTYNNWYVIGGTANVTY